MPLYEYRCKENGHEFEVIQKMSDEPLKKCKFCTSAVEKIPAKVKMRDKFAGIWAFDRSGRDILRDK